MTGSYGGSSGGRGSAPGPVRRRGRPRREEGPAVTADAIVEAGLAAIQDNGWSGLALRDVARRLGVTLPAVQRHFPTKDELWRACVDRLIAERFGAGLGDELVGPADRLLAALRARFERSGVEPGLTAAMLHDRSEGAEERLDYLCRAVRPVIESGRDRLTEAVDAGVMRPVDIDIVLALIGIGLSSLANGGPALQRLFGIDLADEGQREYFAATLADILIFGLRGPAAPVGPSS